MQTFFTVIIASILFTSLANAASPDSGAQRHPAGRRLRRCFQCWCQSNILICAGGNGIVRNNRTGKDTYINMASAGIGIGLGVKGLRAVFIFHDREKLGSFIEKGRDFSGQADAACQVWQKKAMKPAASPPPSPA